MLDLTPAPPAPGARAALDAVLDLAAGLVPLDRRWLARLRRSRGRALATVEAAAAAAGAGALRGSWRWGDFHLDERTGRSCSDVDLFGRDTHAAGRLSTGAGPLRVAVHAVDYERSVSLRVSYAFALVNLATARVARADDPYLLAKAQLMLARQDTGERYADVAARLGGPPAVRLVGRKLGLDHGPAPGGWTPGVPVGEPPPPLAPVLEQLLVGRPHRTGLEALRRYVENGLPELDERHRRYVGDKVLHLARTVVGP